VQFPSDQEGYANTNFQALLQASSPATFGRGSQDVLGPQYRKALCLGADKFVVNNMPSLDDICDVRQR
jgi:hypothetical protein